MCFFLYDTVTIEYSVLVLKSIHVKWSSLSSLEAFLSQLSVWVQVLAVTAVDGLEVFLGAVSAFPLRVFSLFLHLCFSLGRRFLVPSFSWVSFLELFFHEFD